MIYFKAKEAPAEFIGRTIVTKQRNKREHEFYLTGHSPSAEQYINTQIQSILTIMAKFTDSACGIDVLVIFSNGGYDMIGNIYYYTREAHAQITTMLPAIDQIAAELVKHLNYSDLIKISCKQTVSFSR